MSIAVEVPATNALAGAVEWVVAALSGSVATAIAVIAIASIGLLMLSGRVDVRRALQAVLGCSILFGASSIAAGIVGSIQNSAVQGDGQVAAPLPAPNYPQGVAASLPRDPYAGAAVPPRR